ncbi:MAG: IS21 family transposase [Erysipelotrichaceae bacterium]|nr:IS21 family transposase [Erysipelotrichaceae bacterium]
MSKRREVLRLLSMGLSQRTVAKSAHVSPRTVIEMIRFCENNMLSYKEALQLTNSELNLKKRKEVNLSSAKRPDCPYIHKELAKKGVTLKTLHDEYVQDCMSTGEDHLQYTQFCNVYKAYVEEKKLTMHIQRKPGERMEVDWSGTKIPIYDITQKEVIDEAYLFVGVLPFSQYMYAAASLDMKSEAWINHHINMFRFFGGVADILQCDNLKTGVISHKKYDEVIYNQTYQEMCEYYGTAVLATRVRAPKDKASSEGSVGYLTNQIMGKLRDHHFTSIFELNEAILKELKVLNDKPFQKRDYSRTYVYENEEKAYLKPLPDKPFEFAIWKKAVVQYNYHVACDYNYYSVPYTMLRKEVDLRISQFMIEVFYQGERIVSHPRVLGCKGKYITLEEHMPQNHKDYGNWNKERIEKWAESVGPHTYRVIHNIFENAKFEVQVYNQCITILKLSDKYSPATLESTCEYILMKHISPIHKNFMMVIDNNQTVKKEDDKKNSGAILRGPEYYGGKGNDQSEL